MIWEEMEAKLLKRRILVLGEDVSPKLANRLKAGIVNLNLRSPAKPITLIIDSEGGDALSALSLADFIRLSRAPIVGLVIGACESAAVLILQACHRRLATPHSYLGLHYTYGSLKYRLTRTKGEVLGAAARHYEFMQWGHAETERLLTNRTGKTLKEIRRLVESGEKEDDQIPAGQAKKLGFIDEVVERYPLFGRSNRPRGVR